MATFTSTRDLNMEYEGHDIHGAAGTTHRIPDSLFTQFALRHAQLDITWLNSDEIGASGGVHPSLAAHDILGLATDVELDAHEDAADPHTVYALDTDLATHTAAADPHTAYQRESEKGVALGYAGLDSGGTVPDAQLPSTLARDSEVTTAVANHAAAGDPHTGYALDGDLASYVANAIVDAKGDIIAATAADTVARVAVGADDTILMADAAATAGIKWVASATPSTQAFADAAAVGTGDTFTRGDHKHAMPTLGFGLSGNSAPAVGLTTSQGLATATTSVSAATYADVTGASISLAAGTWLVMADVYGLAANLAFLMHAAITDGANAIVREGSQFVPASGTASVNAWGYVGLHAIVTPGSTTTYKIRAARGLTTLTNTWAAQDGSGANVANNASSNTDKGTGIIAIRLA